MGIQASLHSVPVAVPGARLGSIPGPTASSILLRSKLYTLSRGATLVTAGSPSRRFMLATQVATWSLVRRRRRSVARRNLSSLRHAITDS
ncbi:hypothetical protein PsYK624_052870 [Phanerochaete sordida]|uniref:Uncharacterized protein n=1 Tax=Phanerochaete sordida TaxID=48140 RepID=A0A9P3G6Y8_9APHY|nr:hypothetical protein PsYK624_052870 [Phanerochaete sordida]